ncbi:tetratricopeptide repeat protein [Litorimonas sp. WD9-15]|uniref:tetratricopeptide repeat protein n=1 Tax=Litorimonas sp. WD9-15 TaxID=3418716 RepID=UPI003CFD4C24
MCGAYAPAALATPTLSNPAEVETNFQVALDAYNAGKFSEALALSETAANLGSADAAVMAGYILRYGQAGRTDMAGAREWYEKAAFKGHPDAYVALGEMGIREQAGLTKADAVSWLTRASDAGRTDAMRALSDLYRTGQGIDANTAESKRLLEQASQSFDADATKRLGDSVFESDPQAALKHYEAAAKDGHIEAAYIAGVMYAENFDIRPNSDRSAALLRQAAKGGHPAAMADYGLLVYQGYGAAKSIDEAAQWFRKSAEAGDAEGQFLYAFTLAKGEGVPASMEDAYYWVLKSGETGVDEYDADKRTLREGLEGKLDPATIARVKAKL